MTAHTAPPEHRSYSQLGTWLECGERYRLERVRGVPRRSAWWFAGGIAVHSTIELYLRERIADGPATQACDTTGNPGASPNPRG